MKTHLLLTVAIVFSQLIPTIAFSTDDKICQQEGVYVIFCNGIWNDKENAKRSRALLASRLESYVSGTNLEGIITYDTAYNPSNGALLDSM